MFKVGQEIVCVDDSPGKSSGIKSLKKWKTYIVLAIGYSGDLFVNDNTNGSWNKSRFRPLDEVLSEISIEEVINQPLEV